MQIKSQKNIMLILFYIIAGLVIGLLSGLLGIGGGIISVPALFYLFHIYDFPREYLMHTCIATSLAATLITSTGATFSHHKKRALLPSALKNIVPGLIVGCLLGASLSIYLPSRFLQIFFGCMSMVFAVYFFFPKLPQIQIAPHPNKTLLFFGFIIGILSSLLGVGGGIFMLPVLLWYHVSLQNAVASSSAGTLATAFAGTAIYLFIAYGKTTAPHTVGFINIPALLGIGISSLCTTSIGCKLSHILPPTIIKRVFAIALTITGLSMILSN